MVKDLEKVRREWLSAHIGDDPRYGHAGKAREDLEDEAYDYSELSLRYAEDIEAGKIPACLYIKLAIKRFLRDFDVMVAGDDLPYTYDPFKARRVCYFIEQMPHVKGTWSASKLKLVGWQLFVICNVFGWVHTDIDTELLNIYLGKVVDPKDTLKDSDKAHAIEALEQSGDIRFEQCQRNAHTRRFRYVYIEVARKNAKSTLTSGVANYLLLEDDEPGAEVYSAATTRDQAAIVYNDCQAMLRKSPGLLKKHGVEVQKYQVYVRDTNAKLSALSADAHTLDGLNVHGAMIDELHAHKTPAVYDVLKTGTGARRQSLLWAITTAGFNLDGVCYQQRGYVIKMLEGTITEDPSYFGLVYTLDEKDIEEELWMTDESVWIKANPNLGVSKFPKAMKQDCQQAIAILSERNNFMTKHLDVWMNADISWMDMMAWNRCGDSTLSIEQFEGRQAIVTVDLSSNKDLTAVSYLLFDDATLDVTKKLCGEFYLFVDFFLPEETLKNAMNKDIYDGWVRGGHIKATPGNRIDQVMILESIQERARLLKIPEIAYDPWNATQFALAANREGFEIMEYRMSTPNLNEAMKELESNVLAGQLHHTACPVLQWNMSNVIAKKVGDRDIRPAKESESKKIDGAVAAIMGFGRHVQMLVEAPAPTPTLTRF